MISVDLVKSLERRRSRLESLAGQVTELENKHQNLQRAIADYEAFQPEIEKEKIATLEIYASKFSKNIADQEVNKTNLDRRLQSLNAAKVSPLVVWQYFTAEQKKIRSEASRLSVKCSSAKENLSREQEALTQVRADINVSRKRIADHQNFDPRDSKNRLLALKTEIDRLKGVHKATNAELARIETKIRPHTQELDRLKSDLANVSADISRAELFEQELSTAINSYERAMIHNECEDKFGIGSPKQVINKRRGIKRSLEKNIPKLERRIANELQKLERNIGHLLIDGNNVCYEGQSFIGLSALSALLKELDGRYNTTVVFDASIRAMLKTDTQGVERNLDISVNMYIAPTKSAADEYLMKLAGKDKNTFILSNDRYTEYHDYDVVQSNRVLRFLIADGKLMANDIDITVTF